VLLPECLWNRQAWCYANLGQCCLIDDDDLPEALGEDPF